MASLRAVYVHPLKSGAAIALESARVERLGLAGDRRWVGSPGTELEFAL